MDELYIKLLNEYEDAKEGLDKPKSASELVDDYLKNGGKVVKLPTIKKDTLSVTRGRGAKNYFGKMGKFK